MLCDANFSEKLTVNGIYHVDVYLSLLFLFCMCFVDFNTTCTLYNDLHQESIIEKGREYRTPYIACTATVFQVTCQECN